MKCLKSFKRSITKKTVLYTAVLFGFATANLSGEKPVAINNPSSHLLTGNLGESRELSVYLSVLDDEGAIGIRVVDSKTKKAVYTIDLELGENGLSKAFYSKMENGDEVILRDEDGDFLPEIKLIMTTELISLFELTFEESMSSENPRMLDSEN